MTVSARPATQLAVFGFVAVILATAVAAAPDRPAPRKAADFVLDYGFPPIPPAHAQLASLESAPGAPAVILLEAEMHEQQLGSGNVMQRVHYWRRVKILTPAGIETWSDWSRSFYGFRRVQTVEARTVLPNGDIVDAKDSVFREMAVGDTADRDVRMIRIAWPRVEVGAILDLYLSWLDEGIPVVRWTIQHDVPVLDSRLILQVPKELQYNRVGTLLAADQGVGLDVGHPRGRLRVWSWESVPARVAEPFAAPREDSVRSLIVYPAAMAGGGRYAEYAPDWSRWGGMERARWDKWWSSRSAACKALAVAVAAGAEGPLAKAEAIRRALLERVRVGSYDFERRRASPDDVLSAAEGTSGEVAAIAAHMMRSVGLEADLVAFRRRSTGKLVKVAPIPTMLDAAVVRVAASPAAFFVGFDGVTPAGVLPGEAAGVTAIPLDLKRTGPIDLPDVSAADNGAKRVTRGAIDRDGAVTAKTVFAFTGPDAAIRRAELRPLDAQRRVERIQDDMRAFIPGMIASSVAVRGLEDLGAALEVEVAWRAEGYAVRAGNRMLVKTALLDRIRPEQCAADERFADIDLGRAGTFSDHTVLQLPDGATVADVPPAVESDAAPVGHFAASHGRDGSGLTYRRELRIDVGRLAPTAWSFVQPWLQGIAEADDVAVIIELP